MKSKSDNNLKNFNLYAVLNGFQLRRVIFT